MLASEKIQCLSRNFTWKSEKIVKPQQKRNQNVSQEMESKFKISSNYLQW